MEESLFGSSAAGPHSPTAQRRLELLDCLCAMEASSDEEEEEEAREGEGGEACPKEPPDAVASEAAHDGGASAAGEASAARRGPGLRADMAARCMHELRPVHPGSGNTCLNGTWLPWQRVRCCRLPHPWASNCRQPRPTRLGAGAAAVCCGL